MNPQLRQQYQWLQVLVYALQQPVWLLEEKISRREAFALVINFAQEIGFELDPDDPEFLSLLALKISQILAQPPEEITSLPTNLKELLAAWKEHLNEERAKTEKIIFPTLDEQIKNLYEKYRRSIQEQLQKSETTFANNPFAAEIVSYEITKEIITHLPAVSLKEIFSQKEYQDILAQFQTIIIRELKKAGVAKPKIETNKTILVRIASETYPWAKQLVATPHASFPVEEILALEKPAPPVKPIPPLPEEILAKLKEKPEEVVFLPIYTLLQPKVTTALIERIIYTVPAKILKIASPQATPEWQAMIEKGLFVEDIQVSMETLKQMGVPEDHPALKALKDKMASFWEQQKFPVKRKDGTTLYYKDFLAARILKHYYRFAKITGRKRIFEEDLKIFLPRLAPQPPWEKKRSYSYYLYRGLSKFRFATRSWRGLIRFFSGGKYESLKPIFKLVFYQKTLKPIFVWLGKTAVGRVITSGVRKAALWLAAKSGVKIIAKAVVGALVGIPTGGLGTAITLALSFIGERLLKPLWEKVKSLIVGIIRKPEKALGAVAVGTLALVFLPLPLALVGIIPLVFGVMGILGWAFAPTTIGTIAGGITAFFTAVSTIPFVAPIALFIIILFSALAGLTLFVVMVASGAFILPTLPTTPTAPPSEVPFVSPYFDITKTVSPDHLENKDLPTTVTYTITISPKGEVKLIRPTLKEEVNVSKEGSPISLSPHSFEDMPSEITSSWSTNYQISLDERFKDSAITNTITLYTEIEEKGERKTGRHQGQASAIITIGKPPLDCPSGYPTDRGTVSQGPFGGYSHRYLSEKDKDSPNQIAIDIPGANMSIKATHNGTVEYASCGGAGYGIKIKPLNPCKGVKDFYTLYCHLAHEGRLPQGAIAKKGDIIGKTADWILGPHLHYEFGPPGPREWPTSWRPPIEMKPPYFPQTVPYECRGNCGVSW